ncbi:MAG: toll/interleukin-1 receptor domain-containing protein [Chloroflexi bacterium]|nr:toll/interleukin-1 receptor domain-containing protein [Chloroflexota bacterium]
MDVKDLRAGEDWETRLFEWIDQADIIHLLWSENSAKSDYCRKEWTYALEKKCGDTRCFGVIRPIYWQKPMPNPPPELAHLHFQLIKLEDE